MTVVIFGLLTALVIIVLTVLLARYFSPKLVAATILCAMAFIYVGFALQRNSVKDMIVEVAAALLFYFVAMVGYSKYSSLIGYGIVLHGVWDFFHRHSRVIETDIPAYWPSYCLIVDLIIGIYFVRCLNGKKERTFMANSIQRRAEACDIGMQK